MTSVKKAATSWNSWSCFFTQVTTVRKSTPWWMRQLGSLILTLVSCLVWFFPVETAPVFFSHFFFWAGRSSKGEARLSERLSPIMSGSLRIALMQGRKRSWVTYDERSKSCHMVFIGVHMVSIWVRDRSLFHPHPQTCKVITNARFSIVFILGKPFDKMMKHCELLWTCMATWAFRAIPSGVRPLRHGFCKHWKHAMPRSAIDVILETFVCWDMSGTVFSSRS